MCAIFKRIHNSPKLKRKLTGWNMLLFNLPLEIRATNIRTFLSTVCLCTLLALTGAANATVPEQFQRFDPTSENTINYRVLTQWLKTVVMDIGRSDRMSARNLADIGTRISPNISGKTAYEGNRFFFENFVGNEKAQQALKGIRENLERIPSEFPLEYFNRDEQLAYWLNLYNITILNEVVAVYPQRNLRDLLVGEDSILSKKLLTVSGISLSLNDIQFTILKENYDNNPLIIYGLYQGIIGGPSIRPFAFSGASVYRALSNNASEFINSNRGIRRDRSRNNVRKVSSLYERNNAFFPDFNADLHTHLMKYLEGSVREKFKSGETFSPVIDDWTVTDLFGTFPEIRTAVATNPAAFLGALVSTVPGDPAFGGGVMGASIGGGSSAYLSKITGLRKISPRAFRHLIKLNKKWVDTNRKKGIVTMEELGDFPVDPEAERKIKEDN